MGNKVDGRNGDGDGDGDGLHGAGPRKRDYLTT